MKNFLKTQFDSHLHHNDGDAFHSLTHALCKPCRHDTTKCDHGEHSCSICIHPENKFECNGCKFPYWLLAQLYDEVNKVPLSQEENNWNDSSERGNLERQNQQESILVEDVTEEDEEDKSSSSTSSSSSPLVDANENDSVPDLPHLRLDDEDERNEI